MTTLALWWALLWRFTLLSLALAIVLLPFTDLFLLGGDPVAWLKMRPSVVWWLAAAAIWLAVTLSPEWVPSIVWGRRLGLDRVQWRSVCHGMALFFVGLGACNHLVASFGSTSAWVHFQVFWQYPLFALFLAALATRVGRRRA